MAKFLRNLDKKKISDIIYSVFRIQEYLTHIHNINYPKVDSCIYAIWHSNLCCVHGLPNRDRVNIMISRSRDGEIISNVVRNMGYKVVSGSKGKKGATEATLQMITELKNGNYGAIMVDGPNGPAKVCKDGVIKIAKLSGAPIVPVCWYSNNPTLLKFPTWDKFQLPVFNTYLVNVYGEPIYVDKDNTDEQDEEIRLKLEKSLQQIEDYAPKAFKDTYWFGIWKKKK